MLKELLQAELPHPEELIRCLEENHNILYIKWRTKLPLRDIYTVKKAWQAEYGGKVWQQK